jgi:hypothetical protein
MTRRWLPTNTNYHLGPPPVGRLMARDHAVWRITAVTTRPLSDADRDMWMEAGMPDIETWPCRPYRVNVEFIAGARPDWARTEEPVNGSMKLPAVATYDRASWDLYPESGRWPMCSCCGEPMPCRAELQDREVAAGLAEVEKFAKKMPGCCWACSEPITSRQRAVAYPGDNLDLPGGPPVRFHTRAKCGYDACQYELRWIAVDPRRERILTYPKCSGILVVHANGSSECRSGGTPFGTEASTELECRGHLTHDHGVQQACYVGDAWLEHPSQMPGCPRGCQREGHPGTRTTPRPERRSPQAQLPG